jgi:hypothetical protein
MAAKSKTSSFSADPPPSYAEAMAYVQVFSGHLTQVMVVQQCSSLQNNSEETDQDEAFVKEHIKKRNNTIGWWILQLVSTNRLEVKGPKNEIFSKIGKSTLSCFWSYF